MVSRRTRTRKDGTVTIQLLWRENGKQQGHTVYSEHDANVWERLIDQTGSWDAAAKSYRALTDGAYTVAQAVEDHIGLLLKPHSGTIQSYNSMLENHIKDSIGAIPVTELTERNLVDWVRGMQRKPRSAKTIKNVHGLISAALDRCVPERIPVNPCKRVDLPSTDHAEDLIRFLTYAEFQRIHAAMPDRYKPFVLFLVVTGARFSEATAVKVRDVLFDAFTNDHGAKVSAVRLNKAWKRMADSQWIIDTPKNNWSKRTVSISTPLADELRKLCEGRGGDELLFLNEHGGRVRQSVFYELFKGRLQKIRSVDSSFTADPTLHDMRHTSASWLIQQQWPLFKIARRLGHRDTSMIDRVYGHLMPEGMIEGARRIEDAMRPKELEQPDPEVDEE